MRRATVESFAKVNLGLAVTGRRPDGFHDIETIFQSVSLSDTLELVPTGGSEGVELKVTGLPAPDGPENLAWRAAAAAQARFGCPGVAIELAKRIPIAAGLGGGSADAAGVLVGLNELFGLRVGADELRELALELGSDVPFMLEGGTALGTGRGEVLEPLPLPEGLRLVLVTPPFGVSAAEAYESARIGLTEPVSFIRVSCSAIRKGDIPALCEGLRNDLEDGVVSACPEVAVVKRALLTEGALASVMSGSGPTVIGLARNDEEATGMASRLAGRDWEIHVVAPVGAGQRVRVENG